MATESEVTTNPAPPETQPRIELYRSSKGSYGWRISAPAATLEEAIQHARQADDELQARYG